MFTNQTLEISWKGQYKLDIEEFTILTCIYSKTSLSWTYPVPQKCVQSCRDVQGTKKGLNIQCKYFYIIFFFLNVYSRPI